ncbi:MAG: DEAD/DEAH box helicase [Bdellovibrionaceae bacterium]|nr:DEAD/DEAH box helicase [Pseudobdellovibrionaceae bacterium]
MFLIPLSLRDISLLREPSERVPLGERHDFEAGLEMLTDDRLIRADLKATVIPGDSGELRQFQFFWDDPTQVKPVRVEALETRVDGPLNFSCSHCEKRGRAADSCPHQWASYVGLFQSMTAPPEDLKTPLKKFATELRAKLNAAASDPQSDEAPSGDFADVQLESLSLVLDETGLLQGASLPQFLNLDLSQFRLTEPDKGRELHSPRLWNLPEVFRKRIIASSGHQMNEVNTQNRVTEMLRYNFSNGMQINAKFILRHPLHRRVPGDLLPQPQTQGAEEVFAQWPLLQRMEGIFVSQNLLEPVKVMQALLATIARKLDKDQIKVYLQTQHGGAMALKLESIEFNPERELDWRVDFKEKKELETEIKLVNFRNEELQFFESFALEPKNGVIIVHPWLREFQQLERTLAGLSPDLKIQVRGMPVMDLIGEFDTKIVLRYLRGRTIPVKVTGESRTLSADKSLTEVRLDDQGRFFIQHEARVMGQVNLVRRGFSMQSVLYLQALQQGLPFFLKSEPKDIASRTSSRRDWDLKLLKHLGIMQYIFFEVLSLHFDGTLSDGTKATPETLLTELHPKLQPLLIAGGGGTLVKDLALTDLCSKPVLTAFDEFVKMTFRTLSQNESFYSESGEIILEGAVEREFRIIFELIKRIAWVTKGEVFRRSRTGILQKITIPEKEGDPRLRETLFHFPVSEGSEAASNLHVSIECLQPLIPFGFRIFFHDQPLQELGEDEFQVDFALTSETDERFFNWFELNPKFFLRGEEVNPDQFLSLGGGGVVEYAGKLYLVPQKQLPSLRRLENFWKKLQKGKDGPDGPKKKGPQIYQLPRSQTLELLALRASGVKLRGDENWQRLCEFYDNLGHVSRDLKLPASTTAELKEYQKAGVRWLQDLYQLHLGALLADDMGLGKTLQTLAFMDDLRDKGELGQALLVVPSSLIFNWEQEVAKFTPKLPLRVFSAKDQDRLGKAFARGESQVVITTYGLLMEHGQFFSQYRWKILVFDEAQNLKNITTKRTSAARALTAQFKICLTGTPMENHYGEFYSLVDLLVPGSLGKIDDFRRKFVNTEMVTREEIDDLKLKIRPLLLRRTKKEILDQLPEKQETKVSIAFEDKQKQIYRDIALSYNQRVQETMKVEGEASVQLQMLTALLRLRQACSDPAALPNVKYDKVPPKLETLIDSLGEIVESGESALVFTQFLQTLEHTESLLKAQGIPVFVLHGGVPTKQRQKLLGDFHALKGGGVMLMTLKTGGVGLNLTKASYVFHLEPWWNPSVENQATDRAHRLGQNRAVQVFRYIMHESLEEKIELLKERKDRKFQALFTSTEKEVEVGSGGASLSKADFDMLLGIGDG